MAGINCESATERRGCASSVDKPWGEASFVASAATLVAGDQYSLLKTIPIPGDYNWDYLTADSEGRRLYVSTIKTSRWWVQGRLGKTPMRFSTTVDETRVDD